MYGSFGNSQNCHYRTCCGNPWFNESGVLLTNHARTTMDYRNKCGNDTVSGIRHFDFTFHGLLKRPKTIQSLNASEMQTD